MPDDMPGYRKKSKGVVCLMFDATDPGKAAKTSLPEIEKKKFLVLGTW